MIGTEDFKIIDKQSQPATNTEGASFDFDRMNMIVSYCNDEKRARRVGEIALEKLKQGSGYMFKIYKLVFSKDRVWVFSLEKSQIVYLPN